MGRVDFLSRSLRFPNPLSPKTTFSSWKHFFVFTSIWYQLHWCSVEKIKRGARVVVLALHKIAMATSRVVASRQTVASSDQGALAITCAQTMSVHNIVADLLRPSRRILLVLQVLDRVLDLLLVFWMNNCNFWWFSLDFLNFSDLGKISSRRRL